MQLMVTVGLRDQPDYGNAGNAGSSPKRTQEVKQSVVGVVSTPTMKRTMPKLFHPDGEGHPVFVTASCFGREPFLGHPENAMIALRTINRLRKDGAWWISEYVIMPDHVHLIVYTIKSLGYCMQEFKKSVARLINGRQGIIGRKVWDYEYHERVIRDDREYREKVNYIWWNPVKRNLCKVPEEYSYSSARPEVITDRQKFY